MTAAQLKYPTEHRRFGKGKRQFTSLLGVDLGVGHGGRKRLGFLMNRLHFMMTFVTVLQH